MKLLEETEPASPRNLTIELLRIDDDAESDEVNYSNYDEERPDVTISSLVTSVVNGTPSNDVPSLTNIICDIEHGANSPTRKSKRTS